jgi:hypothetical protein
VTSTDDALNYHAGFAEVVGVSGRTLHFQPDPPSGGPPGAWAARRARRARGDAVQSLCTAASARGWRGHRSPRAPQWERARAGRAAAAGRQRLVRLFPDAAGAGWRVSNSRFVDMFQRILLMHGPARCTNNTVLRLGSGVNVGAAPPRARAWRRASPPAVVVTGNTFVDAGARAARHRGGCVPSHAGRRGTDPSVVRRGRRSGAPTT